MAWWAAERPQFISLHPEGQRESRPRLAKNFALTAALTFAVFLVIFRSGLERLLATIPSLFAPLATFLGMRMLGGSLNVATIVATTVLGTPRTTQIHFLHHMHERGGAGVEERIRHALRVSVGAIFSAAATLCARSPPTPC